MLSPDNQAKAFADAQIFPATPAAYDKPQLKAADPFFGGQVPIEVFGPAAKDIPVAYEAPADAAVAAPYNDELKTVQAGGKTSDAAWADAVLEGEGDRQAAGGAVTREPRSRRSPPAGALTGPADRSAARPAGLVVLAALPGAVAVLRPVRGLRAVPDAVHARAGVPALGRPRRRAVRRAATSSGSWSRTRRSGCRCGTPSCCSSCRRCRRCRSRWCSR